MPEPQVQGSGTDGSSRVLMATAFPIVKFGARWVCDGPDGRFHARTKAEAERLLAEALDEAFTCPECGTGMIRSSLDAGFLIHAESTDCVPDPWPVTV